MTPERGNQKIAEACGKGDLFAIQKGDCYYRENAHGYTDRIAEAWHLPRDVAKSHLVRGEPMRIVPVPPPDYHGDLNAIREAVMAQSQQTRVKINGKLMDVVGAESPYGLDRTINATAAQRWEALLRTLNLWEEE